MSVNMNPSQKSVEKSLSIPQQERQRCEIWTRVMGYHRPMSSFNIGKKGEFFERRYFREQRCNLG